MSNPLRPPWEKQEPAGEAMDLNWDGLTTSSPPELMESARGTGQGDLYETICEYYGKGAVDEAIRLYRRLQYEAPNQPLTSLDPAVFAKELLDEGKRVTTDMRRFGEAWTVADFVFKHANLLETLHRHVHLTSLKETVPSFGSRKVHLLKAAEDKTERGEELTPDEAWTRLSSSNGWRMFVCLVLLPLVSVVMAFGVASIAKTLFGMRMVDILPWTITGAVGFMLYAVAKEVGAGAMLVTMVVTAAFWWWVVLPISVKFVI